MTQPTSLSSDGLTPAVSASAGSGLVVKAAPGNLYSASVSNATSTAGFLLALNATSVPADGAVTPVASVFCAASASATLPLPQGFPAYFSTGIVLVFSSATTPFTKTTGTATGLISGFAS